MGWLIVVAIAAGCGSPELDCTQATFGCCPDATACTGVRGCQFEDIQEQPGNYPPPCGEMAGAERGQFCILTQQPSSSSGAACATLDEADCRARDDCAVNYSVSCDSTGNLPVMQTFTGCSSH